MGRHRVLAALAGVMWMSAAAAGDMTDGQVRQLIVQHSRAAYSGSCPCPYDNDRAGHSCGRRSAWSRAGGASPVCYVREVTDSQVNDFRNHHGL